MRNNIIELLKGVEVEWKALGEVAKITIGEFIHQNNQAESAKYPVYNGGISPTGYYNNFNNRGHKIIVSARGANAGFVNRISKPYWAGNSCYSIGIKDYYKLNWIFIYYFLKENEKNLIGSQQKGSIPSVSKKQMEKLQIPIPPLHVQTEIVRILDTFTALTTELTAELTAELTTRKKQYNYYRDKLLTFQEDEVEWKALGDISEKIYSGGTPKTDIAEYWENGTIPWMSSGEVNLKTVYKTEKFISETGLKNSSAKFVPKNSVVIALAGQGKTRGKVARTRINLTTNQSLASLTFDESKVNPDYVFHFLYTQYENLRQISSGNGARGGLNLQMISSYKVPIPPLKEQARIVEILDKFDVLTNSITEGLPREIELRQKQYEYYRNLLLDFPKVQES